MADVTTIIGETIRFRGNLEGDEELTVRGRVEGTVQLTKTLIVEPSGVVKADVSVENAVISGVVVGNITASDSVEITREGRMVGDIVAPRVILVDGASFRGQIDMGNLELPRPDRGVTRPRPAAAPRRAPPPPPEPEEEAPAARQPEPERPRPRPAPPPRRPEPARPEPPKPPPPRPSPARKASVEAPKPQLMRTKKRKVSVKKR